MAIVYRHKRNDTNDTFYIGIGKTDKRSYSHRNRNKYWYNIVNKVGYTIEIVKTDISWDDACDIENLLIMSYGRKDLGLGLLVNMTDGGDGFIGGRHSEEFKEKMKTSNNGFETRFITGNMIGIETRFIKGQEPHNLGTAKKNNCKVCEITYEIHKGGNIYCSKKCQGICPDFRNKQSELKKGLYIGREFPTLKKSVLQFDKDNNFIKEFTGVREAMDITGALQISKVCKGERNTSGGFIWRYKNINIL